MGRHKTIESSDENRQILYDKYVKPNHPLVRTNVARFTSKKTNIDDYYQKMCLILLYGIDTYNPSQEISRWIISICRREIGKMEAREQTYVDARKGSEFQYSTPHYGYKAKYRRKKDKDFVKIYDESVFKSEPSKFIHDGVDDKLFESLQALSPDTDFGNGTYGDIDKAILNSSDIDFVIHFRKNFYGQKNSDISNMLGITEDEVKSSLNKIKSRQKKIKSNN